MAFSLRSRVVFPVDRPPIEGGVVTIDGVRIVDVGKSSAARDVHDLGDVALLPGFVNAHTHLEFSYLKKPLGTPGIRLADWIRLVIAERGRSDTSPLLSIGSGLTESLRHGVTMLGDIVTAGIPLSVETLEVTRFAEVIGYSRARAASCLAACVERLDRLEGRDSSAELAREPTLRVGISPHAPYTVSPFLLRQLVELAQIRALPVAMHVAESIDELDLLHDGTGPLQELLDERSMWDAGAIPRGSRPFDYLRILAEAPRALVIHGNYLDAEERAFLAEHAERMSLVHCPRTHAYFGHPPHSFAELLASGVRVALGTDSRASNPDLDLLAEMRHFALENPAISPHDVLRLGTLAGAEALGRAGSAGSITPGKLANLVAIPLPADARGGVDELLLGLLSEDRPVRKVWARGELIDR